jgi:hypothetical protein
LVYGSNPASADEAGRFTGRDAGRRSGFHHAEAEEASFTHMPNQITLDYSPSISEE